MGFIMQFLCAHCLQACLSDGWDVVSVEETHINDATWQMLVAPQKPVTQLLILRRSEMLFRKDQPSRHFYVLLEVGMQQH